MSFSNPLTDALDHPQGGTEELLGWLSSLEGAERRRAANALFFLGKEGANWQPTEALEAALAHPIVKEGHPIPMEPLERLPTTGEALWRHVYSSGHSLTDLFGEDDE